MLTTVITYILWVSFIVNLGCLALFFPDIPTIKWGELLHFNGFTLLIWTTVSFFSAVVSSYSRHYLFGFKYHSRFALLCLGFTIAVITLVMSNHFAVLLGSWFMMGVFMSLLIGVDRDWHEAREASRVTLGYFLTGTLFLGVGIFTLGFQSNSFLLDEVTMAIPQIEPVFALLAAICIILAAIVQSAIFPFHRWLLSAMTAPTPASALMHAGFVNGSGILLALFATLFFETHTLNLLLIIGGLTAIVAQFTKLLQVQVKHKLACSTIAQMGFMIMQCGLGLFNAAVAHLILHGFYKAYLFLSSGEEIKRQDPKNMERIRIKPIEAFAVIVYGILGAVVFVFMTGKGLTLNSGIFLTVIVAVTVGQATYNIVKQQELNTAQKTFLPPVLFLAGIMAYALLYNGVTILMKDIPLVAESVPISFVEVVFAAVFLSGFFIMKFGFYRNVPWLYVFLMNLSQPSKRTILQFKNKS